MRDRMPRLSTPANKPATISTPPLFQNGAANVGGVPTIETTPPLFQNALVKPIGEVGNVDAIQRPVVRPHVAASGIANPPLPTPAINWPYVIWFVAPF